MAAKVFAILTAAEAIGPERYQPARQPRRKLIGNHLHVIGGSHNRPLRAIESRDNIGALFGLGGMQTIPALRRQRFAAQLVVAGNAPYVGRDSVLFAQNLLRAQSL